MSGGSRPRLVIVAPACELLDGSQLRDATRRAFAGFPDYFDATLLIQVPKQSAAVMEHSGFRLVAFPKYRSSREYMLQRPSTLRALRRALGTVDAVLAVMPCLEAVDALRLARRAAIRSYCLLAGEWGPSVGGVSTVRDMKRRAADALVLHAARTADHVLTHGPNLRDWLGIRGVAARSVVMGPLVEDDFVQSPPPFAGPGPVRLLVVARLIPTKNLEAVLEATELLLKRNLDCVVDVVGEGRELHRLLRAARARGIQDHVRFLGTLNDRDRMRQLYEDADALVLASRTEGISRAVMEGMAAGLPVITSDVGGHRELLEDGESGILLSEPTPNEIAAAVERLANDPSEAARIGERARIAARQCLHDMWVATFRDRLRADLGEGSGEPDRDRGILAAGGTQR